MPLRRRHLPLALAGLSAPAPARAQAGWAPSRPLRFVVPFPAGGATDVAARILAERLTETLGQPVVVENRTGSSGNIGMENVVRSAPDGHSLLMGTTGALTVNPHLFPNLGFDPAKDLAPVSLVFTTDSALIVNPNMPAQSLAEFLALARSRPGAFSYGSAGAGSSTHMAAELFRLAAGIQVLHVPYRGSAPALNDTVAGNVQFMLDQLPSCIGQVQAGRVRALAVTGPRRSPLLPEVPTVAEAGLPGAESTSWGAVLVPAGTPDAAIGRLHAAVREALAVPAVKERMAQAGADAASSTPAELAALMRRETERWGKVVKDAGISPAG
ncbi:tripartite tricarboxylate transporter substrate binding protein [Craurococcus roseus]|uniref:Tripartite tricarboxylate transporter substrate binding protein n=1 Tax=Craurococcus roseus TaxID=77585 RepID=A0ABN1G2N7_9PROT